MHELLLSAILGIVEGVTEFLPVSSTAHLRIAQKFLGLSLEDEFWKLFAVFIQLGAILAVMVFYRGRLKAFTADAMKNLGSPLKLLKHPVGLIVIAFVCTAVPAFLLKKVIGKNLESLYLMAGSLFVGGVIMMLVDYVFRKGRVDSVEAMKPWQAVFVGLVQILSAVFPGTSRSMSTIAAGQVAGLTRNAALEFSFLVSIPIMIVATLYDLLKYVKETGGRVAFSGLQIADLAVGFLVSFVVAYVVVAWFLRYVRNHGFFWFGVYRILAAGMLLYFLA
jgi:undecaprenyl-diphosphatase